MSIARELVRELRFGDRPLGVGSAGGNNASGLSPNFPYERAALCLVDYLSCAFAGRHLPYAQQAMRAAKPWAFDKGVPAIVSDLRVAPGEAAYLNSVFAASASRTDMHPASTSHPAAVIFPVAFACAGMRAVSGKAFLEAVVAGYEAMGRVGRLIVHADFKKHWRATSVLGSIGGAITAARLLDLDEDQSVNALAISANAASGFMAWGHTGEVDLFWQPANAARAGLTAALLAREGASASGTIFESEGGFLDAYGVRDQAAQLNRRAIDGWEIELIDYKPVPACVFVQAAAFATKRLVDEHEVAGSDVKAVKLRTFASAVAYPGCDNAGPIDAMQPARMSIQYTVASVLARRELTDHNFIDVGNPLTQAITAATAVEAVDEFTRAFPARQGAEVEVQTRSGQTLRARVDEVPNPTEARIRERFRQAAEGLYPKERIAELEAIAAACPTLADVRILIDKLVTQKP